jgi:2-keto-4-pentenoate hydratase/2-oxohepta-3-ene-1,7-dioic acid hydratase in catechol pathway
MNSVLLGDKHVTPSKIVCIGRNYVDHIRELGNEIPNDMVIFIKPNSAISSRLLSATDEALHYEGEICFMVKNNQFNAIGFGLDLTKRELQSRLKLKGLPWERAKAFNGAAVFSSFVKIDDVIKNYCVELKINNQVSQQGAVDLMIYKPQKVLSEILSFMTLNDGDIVMTGTPKGVGVINSGDRFYGKILLADETLTEGSWTAN